MDEQLFKAVIGGHSDTVESLIVDNGSNVSAQDREGCTPLMWASRKGFVHIARTLLRLGSCVNETNHAGETALHWASYHDKLDIGCLLLDHGAHLYAKDKKGHSPISRGVAANDHIANTLQMHKKEQDRWTHDNEQLIAVVSSKSRAKFDNLLKGQAGTFNTQMDQQKDEILESQESALKIIQDATETLQGRMAFFEHEYQNTKTTNHDDGNDNDQLPTPTKKRRKKKKQYVAASLHGGNHGDDYSPRVAACEAQLQEQRSEIAALRAMVTSMTPAAATMATATMPKIKMEEEQTLEDGQILETTNAVAREDNNEKDDLLVSMEQELQRVQEELEASQETANRYKMKCEYYKDRMEQLRKFLKFQP